jgi:phosphopantetheine--protein transferase-like protein
VVAYGERGSLKKLRIGVDLERYSRKRLHLAERFFSAEEASFVNSLEGELAEVEFFKLWSRKEAFYKCIGGEFFEGTLRRSMLEDRVYVQDRMVYLVDVFSAAVGMPVPASLCVAVSPISF